MSRLPAAGLVAALAAAVFAVPPEAQKETTAPVSLDADQSAGRASVPSGHTVTAWASEPLLHNPVSFAFDEHGRCFVAETFRMHDGVIDTRSYMHMLDDDIACRTVEDRLKKYQTHKLKDYSAFADQLRIVWDSTGKGKADKADTFAGGFNRPQDGVAAGVLARKGTVYFTCIPDLYAFTADPKASKPTATKSLATGFGVRDQFIGHDLHGLVMGPDGKLYFSIGDRGFNVVNKEGKRLFNPDSGAVLRCEPDGANMEIVHVGLRNPQELAFDNYGNLFTYDNNSDSGDQARWVQIVEGGDSGWRCGYQYGTLMHTAAVPQGNRGPWNTEKIWHVPGPDGGPPAYVVPPLKHFGNGPSGLAHYPGVGLNDKYKDHFFAVDFTANATNSKIWTLAVKPKGASFEVVDLQPFLQNTVATDVTFGPDGALYWLDWTSGWNKPDKGRIFRVTDDAAMKNPAVKEAQKLLVEGFEKKSVEELAKLLGHPHQQVRLEAQYTLASERRDWRESVKALARLLKESKDPVARTHAVWALGMLTALKPGHQVGNMALGWGVVFQTLHETMHDPDVRVRTQAVREYAQRQLSAGTETLMTLMADADAQVRYHAILAYPRAEYSGPVNARQGWEQFRYDPLFDALATNNDRDAYIRHASVHALSKMSGDPAELVKAWKAGGAKFDTPAIRLGVVLALRKMKAPQLAEFLADADPKVVTEAARAIYDQEILAAMPKLADLSEKAGQPEAVTFRALAASAKLGRPQNAALLASYAARTSEPGHLRVVALKLLADWAKPPRRDWITGLTQALPERDATVAKERLSPVLAKVFAGSNQVRGEAVKTVKALGITTVGPLMLKLVTDDAQPAGVRVEALFALEALKSGELKAATTAALASNVPAVRAAGRVAAAKADPTKAVIELPKLLDDAAASPIEKQMALGVLGTMKESKPVDDTLAAWLDKLIAGKVPPALMLDVLEAAEARATAKDLKLHAPLREKLKQYDAKVRADAAGNMAKRYPDAAAGGDPEKGRDLFVNNAAVYCQRCHKVDGQGGEVGPVMNGIGKQKTADYLIESIVSPNAQIAQGYQSVLLSLADGRTVSGVLRSKDAKQYVLVTPENKVLTIPADDVEGSKPDKSAMPDDLYKKLSRRELRDVIAFLASLTEPEKK